MVSGVNPSLITKVTIPDSLQYVVQYFSYSRWSVNLYWLNHADRFDNVIFPSVFAETERHGYDFVSSQTCCLSLLALGVIFRLFAFKLLRSAEKRNSGASGTVSNIIG